MSESDRTALIHAIEFKLWPQMGDMDIQTKRDLARVAAETRIKLIDLDGDGIPEVVAQSFGLETCGAVGNCFFWVFKKSGRGYASILASGSQSFVIEKTKTNGFLDLTLVSHDSASEKSLTLYRYRSGKYRKVERYDANWSPNIIGPVLKTPVIMPCRR